MPQKILVLRFWHWFSFSTYDWGQVQIKPFGSNDWIDIPIPYIYSSGGIWTYPSIDLSVYSGQSVQIAFNFIAGDDGYNGNDESTGWYIDDISLVTGPYIFNNPESFEAGLNDWSVDGGSWEVGVPTSGPSGAHSYQK
ncbi:MAG: immune inhibitor A [Marinilabiliales bacterium]|nr:immune inhibitor A [Marinilabiliales bacterium]